MKSSIPPVHTWLRLAPLFLVTLILAGCFSGAQTVFGTPTPASAQAFSSRLIASIAARNYRALERMMGDPFLFALWQSEGSEMAPADAIANIREVLIDPPWPSPLPRVTIWAAGWAAPIPWASGRRMSMWWMRWA
jgi:hypothetical protein